ncbi:hypothetical protein PQR71_41820, partial [Paraburkholderia fungorum]
MTMNRDAVPSEDAIEQECPRCGALCLVDDGNYVALESLPVQAEDAIAAGGAVQDTALTSAYEALVTDDNIIDEFERRAMVLRDTKGTPTLDGVRVIEGVRALLAASGPAAPEGWKLVPIHPDTAMKWAGSLINNQGFDFAHATYAAMLAASPAVPAQSPKSCQTGWGDICHMAKHDGVVCPDDSCDIDDGVRAAPAQSGEPVAYVPVHPRSGPLWANTVPTLDADRPRHYEVRPVYFAPQPSQPV